MDVEFKKAIENLPDLIKLKLNSVPEKIKKDAREIKLRINRKIAISYENKTYFLDSILKKEQINECFKSICSYSVNSHIEEIKNGFITIKGGHRAGICGTAVYENNKIINIKDISSINIRIAKQKFGVSNPLFKILNGNLGGILIVGAPASGKTTLIKDIVKNLKGKSVSVVDSRGEIAASFNGIPQNDVQDADVFSFYSRKDGIINAIKTMNPEFIVCDEISDEEDLNAIKICVGSGVKLIATAHCENLEEIKKREILIKILKTKAFYNVVFLKGKQTPCSISSVLKVGDLI